MKRQAHTKHGRTSISSSARALGIAALAAIAILCAARGARAQTCNEILGMPWSEAIKHLYAVHAINKGGLTIDQIFTARGTIASHMNLGPIEVSTTGKYPNVEPDFRDRPTLHITWNHLVQSPGPAGTWENAEIVILEPLQDFDNEMWAATPYDTITLGPHQLGAKTFILANGDTLAGDIRKRITDNAGVTVEAFTGTGARATRDTVDRKLATIAGLWRLHDAQPSSSNLKATDLSKQQKTRASMPVWVTSTGCTAGVQILGDKGAQINFASRANPEPQFMRELWYRNLYLGLHMGTAVEALHGALSPGGEANGLCARLSLCAQSYPGNLDLPGEWVIDPDNAKYVENPVTHEYDEVIPMKQETIRCSSWVGASASAAVAARLTCRALWTKDEIVSRTLSDYAWQLATHILTYAMYVHARVANASEDGLTPMRMGGRLWWNIYGPLAANAHKKPNEIASRNPEALARKACALTAASTHWNAYINALKPLMPKS
ncbi:hypothetical protein [Bradyrhizobium sp. 191]|uniref:hypothetical protein n=1 Tax=Bradyrhizobium sp. 191 TaxID=2782659 RepID=UPI001FFF2D5F|nr:hypothetical protein [Bradyrhizobium sp. 191]UPJ68322.1 hypothetical protein IVB23_13955 [Bradyrhizobium sp. 191]